MRSPRAAPALVAALGTVALLLTLASGTLAQVATLASPAPDASAEPTAPPADGQEALLAWASCMREHGVEMDDPRFGTDGKLIGGVGKDGKGAGADIEGEAYQAALEMCSDLLAVLKPPPDPEQQAEQTEKLLAWAACMREQGIELPDPSADGSFTDYDWKLDLKGEEYIAADEACLSEMGGAAKT